MAFTERYGISGGLGLNDGTSEANAWSITSAMTDRVAGERLNWKGNVTTAAPIAFTNAGTAANPCAWRGYVSTIGDLDGSRTSDSGALSGAFPVVTNSSINTATVQKYDIWENLSFNKTAGTGYAVQFTSASYSLIRDCIIKNSSTNGELLTINATYGQVVNCDLIQNATTTAASILLSRGSLQGCRLTNPGGATGPAFQFNGLGAWVDQLQILDFAVPIRVAGGSNHTASRISARNCSTGVEHQDTTALLVLRDSVFWGDNSVGSEFWKGTSVSPSYLVNVARGFFADASQNFGDYYDESPVALSADPYTSASDLILNSTAGGGADCKAIGHFGNVDLGAIQSAAAGGGGGGVLLSGYDSGY